MEGLTKKQDTVRRFILSELRAGRPCPTHREIATHFCFASSYAAACHVNALITKGILTAEPGKVRALQVAEVFPGVRRPMTAEIPFFGSIPAGFAEDKSQEPDGCVAVDIASIGFK